jgi:RNA polymerase sigma factor (sigma-70 family)
MPSEAAGSALSDGQADATGSVLTDDQVADLLVSRTPEAHRLATWILRDAVAAEDAVQQAALDAWRGRRKLRHYDNAAGWFMTIVVNVCRDELRRSRRSSASAPKLRPVVEPDQTLPLREEIGRAIARLTPDEQVVIGLRYGRDLTVPEIAAQTGIPEGTVKSRLHHSLQHLRSALAAERRLEGSEP